MIIRNSKKIKTVTQGVFQTLRICRQPCSAGIRRCVTAAVRYRCFQICHPDFSPHQKFANWQNILISRQKPFHNQNITRRRYSYCSVHSFFASRTIPSLCFWNRILIHSYFFVTVQSPIAIFLSFRTAPNRYLFSLYLLLLSTRSAKRRFISGAVWISPSGCHCTATICPLRLSIASMVPSGAVAETTMSSPGVRTA